MRKNWSMWASHIFLGRERDNIREVDIEAGRDIAKFYFGQEDVSKLEPDQKTLDTLTQVNQMSILQMFNSLTLFKFRSTA